MLNTLCMLSRGSQPRKRNLNTRNVSTLQTLEDRTLLAAFVWSGLGADNAWSNPENWSYQDGVDAGLAGVPDGGTDDAFLQSLAEVALDQNIEVANLSSNSGVSVDSQGNSLAAQALTVESNTFSFHSGGLLEADRVELGTGFLHAGLNLRDPGTSLLADYVSVGDLSSARLLLALESSGSIETLDVGSSASDPGEVEVHTGASLTVANATIGTHVGHGKLRVHDIDSNLLVSGAISIGDQGNIGGVGITNEGQFSAVAASVGPLGSLNIFGNDTKATVFGDLNINVDGSNTGSVSAGSGSSLSVGGNVEVDGRLYASHDLTINGTLNIGTESDSATATFANGDNVQVAATNVIAGELYVDDSLAHVGTLKIQAGAEARVASHFSELSAIHSDHVEIFGTLRVVGNNATVIADDIRVHSGGLADLDAGPAPDARPQGTLNVDEGSVVDIGSESELTMAIINNQGTIRLTEGSKWRSRIIDNAGFIEISGSEWFNGSVVTIADGRIHVHGSGKLDSLVTIVDDKGILQGDSDSVNRSVINGGIFVRSGGKVIGNSQAFTLTPINIGGEWAPGNSPGESHITGDVEFTGGELQMEIGGLTAGTEHDFVQITGTANLHSGKLAVALIDGHIPSIGSEYRIISAKRVDGHFEGLEAGYHAGGTGGLPVLPNEMRWHVAYDHGLVLSVSPKPPEVIIAATVNKTAEDTDTPGEFTITRAGNTDMGLTVYLSLNGTADESLDYQYIRKEVAFLPGQATAKVTVVGIPDFEEEHSETVIATLESHEDYVVGDENSATVIIENSDVPIDTGGGDGGNDADTGNDDGTDTDFWPDDPIQTGMPAASSASNSASTPERPSKPIASVESIDSTLEDFGTLFEPLIVVDVMNAPDA